MYITEKVWQVEVLFTSSTARAAQSYEVMTEDETEAGIVAMKMLVALCETDP